MNIVRRLLASPWALLSTTVGFVVLVDWLFYGHVLGWTLGAFFAALATVLAVRHGTKGRRPSTAAAWLLVCAAALALVYQLGLVATLLALAGVVALPIAGRRGLVRPASTWLQEFLLIAFTGWLRNFADLRRLVRWRFRRALGILAGARFVFRWLLPLVFTLVFVWLFSLANPLIEQWCRVSMDWIGETLDYLITLPSIDQFLLWAFVAFCVWLLLRLRPAKLRSIWTRDEPPPVATDTAWPSVGLVVRCLALFNLVFLLQNSTDALYLWGGAKLPEGMTYAGYAHRGAYPLVATALLAGAFVLVAFHPGGAAHRSAPARRLVYAWIAQNIVLTLSAAWRLHIYIDAYGLTRLRLASVVWMLLVAFGLAAISLRIVFNRPNTWLLDVNTVALLAVFYGVAWTNIDGFIAVHNARHCREAGGTGGAFDAGYVASLGPEALPAFRILARAAPATDYTVWSSSLREELLLKTTDWRGWTWRRGELLKDFAARGTP